MATPGSRAPAEECQGLMVDEPAGASGRLARAGQVSAVVVVAVIAGACLYQFSGVSGATMVAQRAVGSSLAQEEAKTASLTKRDLYRAKKIVPGAEFQAAHAGESNEVLNRHLTRLAGGRAKPCEEFTLEQLEDFKRELTQKKHPELQDIHSTNRHPYEGEDWTDPRAGDAAEVDDRVLELLPEQVARAARAEKACYDIAMHFTHSLADADKRELLGADRHVPLLPARSANETDAHLQSQSPRLLADAVAGAAVFQANCNACHVRGKNVMNPRKTLKKEDLEKYGMNSAENIVKQVNYGKFAMPRFASRLKQSQIEDVAAYVLENAEKGW